MARLARAGWWLGVAALGFGALAGAQVSRRSPVVGVVEQAGPSVVNISTDRIVQSPFYRGPRTFFEEFFGQLSEEPQLRERVVPNSIGSGVIVDPRGYVLTNEHVVARADNVRVTTADGKEHEAEVRGTDPSSDLAVLKIMGEGPFPAVTLGASDDLMIGESVIAIGNPFGYSHTVTTGVVSSVHRSIRSGDMVYTDFIQTDASINPGNSGGPLLNVEGKLIGINTAILAEAQGIGFAIPVDRAKRALEELIAYGAVRPTWTGLEVVTLAPRLAERMGIEASKGALVRSVHGTSPGSRAGVEPGDVIVRVGRTPIETRQDFLTALGLFKPGDTAPLWVLRGGKEEGLTVRVEALEKERVLALFARRFGLTLEEPGMMDRARGSAPDALLVREVAAGSPAAEVGIRAGDVVAGMNGEPLQTLDALADRFARIWDRDSVLLHVRRRGILYPPVTLSVR